MRSNFVVTGRSEAVFLSCASQDAEAAARICAALRIAGIEVWFDQSELRGGDAWDQSIRNQINECALFLPVISANAHARTEGYFRFEWKLAIDRSHRMAPDQPFLLPIVIDDTLRPTNAFPIDSENCSGPGCPQVRRPRPHYRQPGAVLPCRWAARRVRTRCGTSERQRP
jgi:hypothetical protein